MKKHGEEHKTLALENSKWVRVAWSRRNVTHQIFTVSIKFAHSRETLQDPSEVK